MDGTLTQKGKLTSGLISALESLLRTSNIDLVILIIYQFRVRLQKGVANINHYCDRLQDKPAYITSKPEGAGFST
ncbi:MAG: hypothetical protein QNJ65_18120 [Xenococcaceae cyanobacterium MO_234.B1]|nr:hypothetical protein [Xenococcaceae cyanobacterium MO_234.B1]